MEQSQYNQLFSFIWNIATDVLVFAFDKGEYKKIIMPMMVLRRIDVLLEPTKQTLLAQKKMLDDNKITNQDPILFNITGYPFYNTSLFTMKTLKSETDPLRLKMNFTDYLNGFSKDVQDIIDKFHLRQMVDNLTEAERLGSIIEKFTDDKINLSNKPVLDDEGNVRLPALDNHTMGTMFEELLRRFNEENNVTEAGEHFTPRDYVKLLADLAVIPIADKIKDNTYTVYDGACGTGGILTIAQERIKEIASENGKNVQVLIYGQELQPIPYATCKADLMISGEIQSFQYVHGKERREYIAFDSTISRDGHPGETYDFCISNPPFGTPWKEDLKKRGLAETEKKKFTDSRFTLIGNNEAEISFLPDIGDCQMMFLANNLSRMKTSTELGTRIVEVHNGSSLFTGDAGSGASNLRKYIIENDLLEAIIAMPEKDFYNTPINTYIWVITNRKEERRKGFIQLIDATEIKTPLRKNLGHKNCETTESDRLQIVKLLTDFAETPQSKIFPNDEFGYWSVKVCRPLRLRFDYNSEREQEMLRKEKDKVICHEVMTFVRQYDHSSDLDFNTLGQLLSDAVRRMKSRPKKKHLDLLQKYYAVNCPEAAIVCDADGAQLADKTLEDTEIIPFRYEGGIDGFVQNEILPYTPDAWIDCESIQEGYELSFTKYFYKPKSLRSIDDISKDIRAIENRIDGMLDNILISRNDVRHVLMQGLNPNVKMKDSGIPWVGLIPAHWSIRRLSQVAYEHFISNKNVHHQNLLSLSYGQIIRKDINTTEGLLPASFDSYQIVENGNVVLRLTDLQNDQKSLRVGLVKEEGIITSAYLCIGVLNNSILPAYLYNILHSYDIKKLFYSMGGGLRQNLNWPGLKKIDIPLPPPDEQQEIIAYIESKNNKIKALISDLEAEIAYLKEYKQKLIADCVTGQINVQCEQ